MKRSKIVGSALILLVEDVEKAADYYRIKSVLRTIGSGVNQRGFVFYTGTGFI